MRRLRASDFLAVHDLAGRGFVSKRVDIGAKAPTGDFEWAGHSLRFST